MIAIDDPYAVTREKRGKLSPHFENDRRQLVPLKLTDGTQLSLVDGHPWRLQRAAAAFAGRS